MLEQDPSTPPSENQIQVGQRVDLYDRDGKLIETLFISQVLPTEAREGDPVAKGVASAELVSIENFVDQLISSLERDSSDKGGLVIGG